MSDTATTTKPNAKSGFCATGQHVINDGNGFAAQGSCRGATTNGNGSLYHCGCTCHSAGPFVCLVCGLIDGTRGGLVDSDTRTCLDPEACADTMATRRANNPLHQQIKAIKADHQREGRNMTDTATETTPRAPKAPKTGSCLCCGGETKGGLFLPGHDARFVKTVVGQVRSGDLTADEGAAKFSTASGALQAKFSKALTRAEDAATAAEAKAAEKQAAQAAAAETDAPAEDA